MHITYDIKNTRLKLDYSFKINQVLAWDFYLILSLQNKSLIIETYYSEALSDLLQKNSDLYPEPIIITNYVFIIKTGQTLEKKSTFGINLVVKAFFFLE